jgi:hypothetical protein
MTTRVELTPETFERLVILVQEQGRGLEALRRRLEQLEAQLDAVDASFVRHQAHDEDGFRRLEQTIGRVESELNLHEDAHWRSGR